MATLRLPHRVRSAWGDFVGPEATTTDTTLALGLGAAGAAAAPLLARGQLERHETVILRLMALDLWGGAWANNTKACARWYERPGQSDTDHIAFASLHVHPVILAWMDRDEPRRVPGWVWAAAHYSYLMAATILIRRNAPPTTSARTSPHPRRTRPGRGPRSFPRRALVRTRLLHEAATGPRLRVPVVRCRPVRQHDSGSDHPPAPAIIPVMNIVNGGAPCKQP